MDHRPKQTKLRSAASYADRSKEREDMKLLKKTVLVIVLMVALTVSAFSQVYVSAGGSALLPVEIGSSSAASIEYGLGIRGSGAVGYDLNNGVLAEVEVSYSRANANEVCINDRCVASSQTYDEAPFVGTTSIMVNAQYELETGFPVWPYLGIGAGFQAFFQSYGKLKTGTTPENPDILWFSTSQARAGIAVDVGSGVVIRAGYGVGTMSPLADFVSHRIDLAVLYFIP